MEVSILESMIPELAIQVSVIQESKMQAPTILMVLESNEVLRIQEHFKVQRTIEGSRIRAKFEDLQRRNLHVHETVCQREMHEYGDQNVTNTSFVSMENIV